MGCATRETIKCIGTRASFVLWCFLRERGISILSPANKCCNQDGFRSCFALCSLLDAHLVANPVGSYTALVITSSTRSPLETPHHSPKPRHLSPSEGTPHALSISSTTDGYERDPPVQDPCDAPPIGQDVPGVIVQVKQSIAAMVHGSQALL